MKKSEPLRDGMLRSSLISSSWSSLISSI